MIKKILRYRALRPVALLMMSLVVACGMAGTANAAIYWQGVQLVNDSNQQCLAANPEASLYSNIQPGSEGALVPGCMASGISYVNLWSSAPDGATANVEIQTWDSLNNIMLCLAASDDDPLPSYMSPPAGSVLLQWEECGSSPYEIWSMTTQRPAVDVGNPAGKKHYIGFFNYGKHVCLDGGYGMAYGYYEYYGCSANNNWQVWDIYTNKTSGPYRG